MSEQDFGWSPTCYTLTATGPGGTQSVSALVGLDTLFILQVDAPLDQQTVYRPDVLARGIILNSTGRETGVTVNGMASMQYEDEFMVNHVPLQQGANTLTVTATDTDGQVLTTELTVYAEISGQYCTAALTPETGLSPYHGELQIQAPSDLTRRTVLDFGPSKVTFGLGPPEKLPLTIDQPGLYRFEVEVKSFDNQIFNDEVAVLVYDTDQLDALLKAKWNAMKACLAAGDISGAVGYFDQETQPIFENSFILLQDHLGQMLAGIQNVNMVKATSDLAEYNLVGIQNGQAYSFHLVFIRESDGIWRIKFF